MTDFNDCDPPQPSQNFTRCAFTLVELLVVIGIIAVLISVLLPALNKARAQANFTKCMSNQRQLLIGLQMYVGDNKGTFPGGAIMLNGTKRNNAGADGPVASNPFSLNQNESEGAIWLSRYVKGSELAPLMFCPSDTNEKNMYSNPPGVSGVRRTSYRYSQTMYFTPEIIYGQNITGIDQRPQKITAVKYPANKAVIADIDNYHARGRVDKVDTLAVNQIYVDLAIGFVDGHVQRVNTREMFDTDINWTGRSYGPYASQFRDASTAGVKGRDLK